MNWVKISNSFPSHPKIMRAGPEASFLFVCAVCYSNEHLLDGVIPRDLLAAVAPTVRRPEKHAKRLCDVGLWETTDAGWRIHDYLDFQRSADAIRETRALDSERKRQQRSARSPNGLPAESDSSRVRAQSQEVEKRREEGPPVVPPQAGGRQRDRTRFEREVSAYAAEHFPDLDERHRFRAVRQALIYGHAETLEQITTHIAENFPELQHQLPIEGTR